MLGSHLIKYWEVVDSILDRAHRRLLRSEHVRDPVGGGPITLADGAIRREPSDDADPQLLPPGARTLHPPFW